MNLESIAGLVGSERVLFNSKSGRLKYEYGAFSFVAWDVLVAAAFVNFKKIAISELCSSFS